MKPSSLPPRKPRKPIQRSTTPLARSGIKRSGKPIPKSNPVRQAKVKARYAKKLAAYKKSETCKLVEARSGGQCEAAVGRTHFSALDIREPSPPRTYWQMGAIGWSNAAGTWFRCEHRAKHHHHLRYMRLGGDELPEDMLHVCKRCHDALEAQKPAGNRRSRTTRET